VCASLAIAERLGLVSGQAFITAVALGTDIVCRLGSSIEWKMDWAPTTVFGVFGAAAASAKLLGLDVPATVSALGIALTESAGTQEMRYSVGNHLGGLRDGYPARAGVFSALLAERGIIGPQSSFDGRAGFFAVYFGGHCDRGILTHDLGRRFEGARSAIKTWPTCGTSHVYIDCALRIIREHDMRGEQVARVVLLVGDFARLHCEPIHERRRPITVPDAKYSIPYAVAVAIAKGNVRLQHFSAEALRDETVLQLADRITVRTDPRFNAAKGEPPGGVQIELTTGAVYTRELEHGYGHPSDPVSTDDVILKFRDCVSCAAHPPSGAEVDDVVTTAMRLEQLHDIRQLIAPLRGQRRAAS
jgi:2-methylcitrate dehydratase PrpD